MIPPLPIFHLSFSLTLQHDNFNLLLPTFLLNPVSKLRLLLVASNLLDHDVGTLYQMTSNLLPFLFVQIQTQNSPPYFNSSITDHRAPLIRHHTRFCARYKCLTLHYIDGVYLIVFYIPARLFYLKHTVYSLWLAMLVNLPV